MPALSRWVITGTLTTNSPLHIGDGGVIARADRGGHGPARKGDKQPEISSIATDHEGRACVTASELKGFIRQMLLRHENNAAVLDLLGSQEKGGRVDPGNGFVGPEIPAGTLPPFWCEQRVTGVATSVAIGRRTRAARDKFLAFREFVPAAVPFNVRMRLTSPTEDEIVWLLAALESFSDPFGMQAIGANTVDGWGRMKWALGELRRFDACNVAAWLAMPAGKRPVGFEAAQAIPPAEQAALALKARQRFDAWSTTPRNVLRVHLELPFESDFVVRNPDPACHERPGADFAPVTDANGRPFLPADSFRGALRAQAERILRTRGGMDAACGPGKSCAAVKSVADVKQSCRVCRLFGATGWQSVVRLSDFTTMDAVPKERRHLVAIDRFTGGVAGPRKFEGDVANRPVLLGTLSIDLHRLAHASDEGAELGLLALVLRDLKEGDIAFGAGAGRGWGAVSAEIHGDPLTTMPDEAFTPVVEALVAYIRDRDAMSGAQRNTLKAAIDALPCGAPPITAPEPRLPTGGDVPLAAVPLAAAGAGSFYNPYHFAPMHSQVWGYPIEEWKQGQHPHVGHDRYVEHTWSGRIICTIEAKTPLVVGARIDSGTQNQPQRVIPFEIDGAPAVPGSSLRGMVSSIAEAASNSALRVLNDTHYSYRKEYRQGLSAIGRVRFKRDANGMAMKTRDGSDRYELQPLTYPALVSSQGHGWNECMMKDLADQGLAANDPNRRKWEGLFAVQNLKVYLNDPVSARAWTGSTLVGVQVPEIPDADINGDFLRPAMGNAHNYKTKPAQHPTILLGQNAQSATPVPWPTDDPVEIARLKGAGYRRGYLYVLGSSIGPRMRQMMIGKTHELFIPVPESLDTHNNWFDIPAAVVRAFHGLCAAVTETSRADEVGDLARPYHPVGTLRNNVDSENPDLFILKDGDLLYFDVDKKGDITELSLSSVWRAATKGGDHHTRGSAWAFFDAVHSELTPYTSRRKMLTLADAVFGVATDEKTSSPLLPQPGNAAVYDNGVAALAGRVRVASALWMHGHDRNFYEPEQTLRMMASPKPPSPALYFKRTNAAHQHPIKKTLTVGTHHPNGRKFYLHHRAGGESWQAPQAAVTQRPHLYSRVTPVRRETTFSFHIDVDNLSHEEIGLLMYALKPTPSFRHKLGMGKSTVLGSIEITVAGMWRVNRRTRYTADGLFAARYAEVLAGELVGISLPDRYRRERDAAVGVGPGTWPTQAAQEFRNACPALGPTRRALEMIGISEVVDVSWPLTAQQALAAQQQTAETQHFRWFGQNDMPNVAREVLKPLPESVNASLKKI